MFTYDCMPKTDIISFTPILFIIIILKAKIILIVFGLFKKVLDRYFKYF